jgi:putative redox protein
MFEVEVRNVAGEPAAIGSAGPFTLVVDRPADGGGRGIGFNGGELVYLALRRGTAVKLRSVRTG